ncbi:MAG: hypothetical protein ACSHYA_19335 [Opitutaceae bacterium]
MNTKEYTTPAPTNLISNSNGPLYAIFLMRIWLGIRSLQAGIEKFAGKVQITQPAIVDGKPDPNGTETAIELKVYAIDNYSGVPAGLKEPLSNEFFIPEVFLKLYDLTLGPLLILLGVLVLLGIATRISLLGMGLLYTSLTFGLILLNQSAGVAWLAAHVIMISLMLLFIDHGRYELGNLLARKLNLKFLLNK